MIRGKERKSKPHRLMGEFELIEKIVSRRAAQQSDVIIGPGDDASAFLNRGKDQLILQTTDLLVEGVDFRKEWITPKALGRRALAVNLSDIAAMGGQPLFSHLSLAVPLSWKRTEIVSLTRSFIEAGFPYGISLMGGDLSATSGPLVLSVMITGSVLKKQVLTREGANPGDVIWISGTLGDAAGGLRLFQEDASVKGAGRLKKAFLAPQPEIELGLLCASSGAVSALIDLSDGLAGDLGHILKASRVGAEIHEEQLPISQPLRRAAIEQKWNLLEMVLTGGEEFHLLGCSPQDKFTILYKLVTERLKSTIIPIGRITQTPGLRIRAIGGKLLKVQLRSYDHFA